MKGNLAFDSEKQYHRMSARHRHTLDDLFADPAKANIIWDDVEKMLLYYGATIEERRGSVVVIKLNGRVAVFHRPHPAKEAKRYAVRRLREFLTLTGVKPKP